jgi:tRNA modification GTPase
MTGSETIFALSSGSGRAAIAVVRLSGPQSSLVLEDLAGELPQARQLVLRNLRDPSSQEILDKCAVVWCPGPRSVTGEDVVELHLHGSPAVLAAVTDVLSRYSTLRPADAGEFSRRAFANGKLDLVEVEGLADLLEARTSAQLRQAMHQFSGSASSLFESWRAQLLEIRAGIEAAVDFSEEQGVAEAALSGIDENIRGLEAAMGQALAGSAMSEMVQEGVRVVLAGHPNTGKSSILNCLSRRDVAIVADEPGTTRDIIEVMMNLEGVPVILTDTAGLRSGVSDKIEAEGIRRSRNRIGGADLVLWVWAPDVPGSAEPDASIKVDLFVANKSDLETPRSGLIRNDIGMRGVEVSARTGAGILELTNHIKLLSHKKVPNEEPAAIVSARQKAITERSIRLLNDARSVTSASLELKAEYIRLACDEVGRLTGRVDVEEWLGAIFSRFCIGK